MPASSLDLPFQSADRPVHPMVHAGKWLLADLLSTLLFVAIFAVTKSVFMATGIAIGAGIGQITYLRLRRQPVDFMQWLSLGLVLVFGLASLLTHDPRFIMIKPTLIYLAVGAGMLRKGWMLRYLPPRAAAIAGDVTTAFGYGWAGLMGLTAALNLILALTVDARLWGWFVGVFPIASKAGLVMVQYLVTRSIARARIARSEALSS